MNPSQEDKTEAAGCSSSQGTSKEPPSAKRKHESDDYDDDDDDDPIVTMQEVAEDFENLENDAAAVLGNADMDSCTYFSGGYMKRQPVFACMTCTPPKSPDFVPAVVCLGCTEHCHSDHEVVELYTKRKLKCDCGNSKFPNNPCKLDPDKAPINEDNRYNQNYRGVYCICERPYPDPENKRSYQMIQCVICEDWFHDYHLEGMENLPDNALTEMICHLCANKHSHIFRPYKGLAVTRVSKNTDASTESENIEIKIDTVSNDAATVDDKDIVVSAASKEPEVASPASCFVKSVDVTDNSKLPTLFFLLAWRDQLCKCDSCKLMYAEEGLEFLLDSEDSTHHHETAGVAAVKSSSDQTFKKVMDSLDRVQQVEAIARYNDLKQSLTEYLSSLGSDKVVTPADIKDFFAKLGSKRPRVEIPKFCR